MLCAWGRYRLVDRRGSQVGKMGGFMMVMVVNFVIVAAAVYLLFFADPDRYKTHASE